MFHGQLDLTAKLHLPVRGPYWCPHHTQPEFHYGGDPLMPTDFATRFATHLGSFWVLEGHLKRLEHGQLASADPIRTGS